MQINYGAQFNVPTRGPIPGPSPDPGPKGDWVVKFRGSFVSNISWPQLRSDRLYSLAREKWVCPFSLPWFDLNSQVRPGIPSLAFHRQKEQTDKNISIGGGSSYCACPSWFSPTNPRAQPLALICRNPHQHFQVWLQWWIQYIFPISPKSWGRPLSTYCHSPNRSTSLILFGPDLLGVWRVQLLRWRLVYRGIGFSHVLHCGVQWEVLLCSS